MAADAPNLLTETDAAVASLLQKVGADGSVQDRIDAIKVASAWLAQRIKLDPPKVAKGGGKFDGLRDQFHGGASRGRGGRAKAPNGAAPADPGTDDPSDLDA
jgi:hypothetical protein